MADTTDEGPSTRTRGTAAPSLPGGRRATVEQAKGVLIFRYGFEAGTALALMRQWSDDSGTPLEDVAAALVHEVGQGEDAGETSGPLVQWLHEQLRRQPPTIPEQRPGPGDTAERVVVAVDESEASLDRVLSAAREAQARGVPLELEPHENPLTERHHARILQRLDSAVQLARTVAPGLDVRLPMSPDFPEDEG